MTAYTAVQMRGGRGVLRYAAPSAAAIPFGAPIETEHDSVPDFALPATITRTATGVWSDTTKWSPARLPTGSDRAQIPNGMTVTYDTVMGAPVEAVGVHGVLQFDPTITTKLWTGALLIYPDGVLQIGTASTPIAASEVAEIVIADQALNLIHDPDQYGTSLHVWGAVTMHGAVKTPTFLRLAAEPEATDTTLTLSATVSGWRVGDELILPDSRHLLTTEIFANLDPQWETAVVAGISGTTVTLTGPLQYDHPGARDVSGALVYLPHVGNGTRNVRIRSEHPAGTRAHTQYHDRASVDLRYAEFAGLGRTTNAALHAVTNHIGRYPVHIHHLRGPDNPGDTGYQYTLMGNAVTRGLKWPITLHDSHYGLIQDNVVYDGTGSGLATEEGNESYNVFDHNFVVAIAGHVTPRDNDGRAGQGFWLVGWNNYYRNNVVSTCINSLQVIVAGCAYEFWVQPIETFYRLPLYRGADTHDGDLGVEYESVDMQKRPILEFANNEAYGAMATGLSIWYVGTNGFATHAGQAESLIDDFVCWHAWEEAYFCYNANKITFDRMIARGHTRALGQNAGAIGSNDYWTANHVFRELDVMGYDYGIGATLSGNMENIVELFEVEDSVFQVYTAGLVNRTKATPGTGATGPDKTTILRNCTFTAWPARPLLAIDMLWDTSHGNLHTAALDAVKVYTFQGDPDDNFQAYYAIQATDNVAGGLAPCTDTRSEVDGLACVIAPE